MPVLGVRLQRQAHAKTAMTSRKASVMQTILKEERFKQKRKAKFARMRAVRLAQFVDHDSDCSGSGSIDSSGE